MIGPESDPRYDGYPCVACDHVSNYPVCSSCSSEVAAFCLTCHLILYRADYPMGEWPEPEDSDETETGRVDHIPCECWDKVAPVHLTMAVVFIGDEPQPWEP